MIPEPNVHRRAYWILLTLAMVGSGYGTTVSAQQLPAPAVTGGAPPELPQIPQKQPRPADDLATFVKDLSTNDAALDVPIGQGRILTTKVDMAVAGKASALVAVGDPAIVEFAVLNARQIRVIGLKVGVTDLSITTGDGKTYSFEVRVTADLNPLRGQLIRSFPDARVRISQLRDHLLVEGQARDGAQVTRIMETIGAYMESITVSQERKITSSPVRGAEPRVEGKKDPEQPPPPVGPLAPGLKVDSKIAQPKIINLLRVPGPQQVLLKVKVAELNRTAFRQIGSDFLVASPSNGAVFGTNIAGNGARPGVKGAGAGLAGLAEVFGGGPATVFGIFENSDFALFVNALRRNELLRILAEPNLVALNGHQANFLAGGEFPIPVPQSGIGGNTVITIEFKKFGVRLGFKPDILDGGVVRLAVDPEVSTIDFAIGTSINGTVVPGLNTRNAHTVVEMKEGQTLAMAGLLSVTMEGTTHRIPGLGDVPVLGPFFSNTTSKRQEKELIVLVTPYLVDALPCDQVPPVPGAEINGPNDLEFYLGNRIEGKSGRDWRATTGRYTSPPVVMPAFLRLHKEYVRGPHGFSD